MNKPANAGTEWLPQDDDYLCRNWRALDDAELAMALRRTPREVSARRWKLGLLRANIFEAGKGRKPVRR